MTQEEKQLLLKDLTTRLPYGVKIMFSYNGFRWDWEQTLDEITKCDDGEYAINGWGMHGIKPCLRPISSMTESEIDKLFDILHIDKDGNDEDWIKINDVVGIKFFFPTGKWIENVAEAYDYLNSIHIDYRGLIEKGLALEASEDMY